jgi:hypothetical protein
LLNARIRVQLVADQILLQRFSVKAASVSIGPTAPPESAITRPESAIMHAENALVVFRVTYSVYQQDAKNHQKRGEIPGKAAGPHEIAC